MLRVPSNLYVVVIDIGEAYTKLGYSCENSPSAIIKTEVNGVKILQRSNQIVRTQDQWYQIFVNFFNEIAFDVMLTNLKDRDVTIVESMRLLLNARIAIAKVLFKHFEVASVAYLITPLAALIPLAKQTAIVVNCGSRRTEIVCVCDGIVMLSSECILPYAAHDTHIRLHEILCEDNEDVSRLTKEQLEDIKVKFCFVTTRKRSELYFNNENYRNTQMNVKYLLREGRTINISSAARELSFEDIFLYNNRKCLASVILESISRSPIDYRKELFKNILVIGGTSMARGFKKRLLEDLKRITEENGNCYITRDNRVIPIRSDDIRIFVDLPAKENCLPWLGGAIYSNSGFSRTRSITKNNYLKNENLIHIQD